MTITVFLMGQASQIELVLGTIRGAFLGAPGVFGIHPLPFVSLYSHFIVVFLLLTGVPRVGTCPIRPYLQLLGVVVRTKKYGCVRHKALNTIKAAFPYTLSCFPCPVERSGVSPLMICYLFYPRLYPSEEDFSMAEEGFFYGLGPWPSIDIETGLLVFFPPQ